MKRGTSDLIHSVVSGRSEELAPIPCSGYGSELDFLSILVLCPPGSFSSTTPGPVAPSRAFWTNNNSTDGEIVVAAVLDNTSQPVTVNTPSTGSWSPTTYSGNDGSAGYGVSLFETSSAQSSLSATLSHNEPWGVVAVELNHG